MDKKGFTLIELLAVIVILAVVLLIGGSSMTAIKRGINRNILNTKLSMIISSAKKYGESNKELFIDTNGIASKKVYKTIAELIDSGDLETEEATQGLTPCLNPVDDSDGNQLCAAVINPVDDTVLNSLSLKIYMENNRVYACIPLTSDNKTVLNDTSCVRSSCSGNSCDWQNCEYSDLNYYCVND